MTRISRVHVVQKVEREIVLIHEGTGDEFAIDIAGVPRLVEAIKNLVCDGKDMHVFVAGDGSLMVGKCYFCKAPNRLPTKEEFQQRWGITPTIEEAQAELNKEPIWEQLRGGPHPLDEHDPEETAKHSEVFDPKYGQRGPE